MLDFRKKQLLAHVHVTLKSYTNSMHKFVVRNARDTDDEIHAQNVCYRRNHCKFLLQ